MTVLEHAADFIWRNARLLERTLFERLFRNGAAEPVLNAVRAYRNSDGGFGHALEADIRAPGSGPLHCEIALRTLQQAGIRDAGIAIGVCDFLDSVARPNGSVPIALPDILAYPRAAHWATLSQDDGDVNPTASLAGLLHWHGITHPWLSRATTWCWEQIERPIDEAHTLRTALAFLQYVPDRPRAETLAGPVAEQAFTARYFNAEPAATSYGLTPLHLAPAPDAAGASASPAPLLAVHLDHLPAHQQAGGGWPIAWQPPGPGAAMEWRGAMTLEALTILRAYGRI
jgi:hypothetical protein